MIRNREAFDQLEGAAVEVEYVQALTHAIIDIAQDIGGFTSPAGMRPDEHLHHFVNRLQTLASLQLDRGKAAENLVNAGVAGWPL